MPRLVEFLSRAGGNVVVEVADGLGSIVPVGSQVRRSLRPSTFTAEDAPDEIEVEFGVRLSADVSAIVAKASSETNFKASLRWKGGSS